MPASSTSSSTSNLVDDFLKTDSLDAARRVLTDNGITPVSAACGVNGLWDPNPKHAASIEDVTRALRGSPRSG